LLIRCALCVRSQWSNVSCITVVDYYSEYVHFSLCSSYHF
jgi:hypothetical protein